MAKLTLPRFKYIHLFVPITRKGSNGTLNQMIIPLLLRMVFLCAWNSTLVSELTCLICKCSQWVYSQHGAVRHLMNSMKNNPTVREALVWFVRHLLLYLQCEIRCWCRPRGGHCQMGFCTMNVLTPWSSALIYFPWHGHFVSSLLFRERIDGVINSNF